MEEILNVRGKIEASLTNEGTYSLQWWPNTTTMVKFALREKKQGQLAAIWITPMEKVTADITKWALNGCLFWTDAKLPPLRPLLREAFEPKIDEWFANPPPKPQPRYTFSPEG